MPLWNANTTVVKKPTWLNAEEKTRAYIGTTGWEYKHESGHVETLISDTDLGDKTSNATITNVYIVPKTYVANTTQTMTAMVCFSRGLTADVSGGLPNSIALSSNVTLLPNVALTYSNTLSVPARGMIALVSGNMDLSARRIALANVAQANTTGSYNVAETVYQANSTANTFTAVVIAANSTTVTVKTVTGALVTANALIGASSNCIANVGAETLLANGLVLTVGGTGSVALNSATLTGNDSNNAVLSYGTVNNTVTISV